MAGFEVILYGRFWVITERAGTRNAMAIWQDLVSDHGFAGKYASVMRYVVKLRGARPVEARVVITTQPGEESQVDYGEGPMVRLTRPTVSRALVRHGLSRLSLLEPPKPANLYQWPNPGDMIHLDTKKLGRFQGIGHRITGRYVGFNQVRGLGWEFAHVCVDDASRLSYVELLDDEKGDTAAAFLERALRWFREHGIRVKRVMTENGSCYVSGAFSRRCWRHHLRHIRTKPYTPRTNGKAERFIQTMLREWAYAAPYSGSKARARALPRWLGYYNRRRPHSSLDDVPPIARIRSGPVNNVLRNHS